MDDVERMYRHLVRTIRATSPQLLTQPFEVGDLYSTILPYRLHRRELGLETNQDYEMAMLELLSGGRGYLAVDERMRDVLGSALRSPNPDPAAIRDFSSSRIALLADALQKLEMDGPSAAASAPSSAPSSAPRPAPQDSHATSPALSTVTAGTAPIKESATAPFRPSTAASAAASSAAATAAAPAQRTTNASSTARSSDAGSGSRRMSRPVTVLPTGEQCRHCKGDLPAGRQISFCPHCGQDLTILHCPACGSELEHGWKFCVTCGRTAPGG